MSKYDEIIALAAKDIGLTENPPGSNRQKYGKWYGWDGVSWCMQFVQYLHAGIGCGLPYKTASCSGLLNWYKAYRPNCIHLAPKKGYIAIYNFGHTGIVESYTDSTVTCIEGNTSQTNKGSQDNGGGVYRRTRSKTLVTAYIDGINIKEEEDIMTKEEILKELGDEYIKTFDELPKWAQKDMRELLDKGIINGGTDAKTDPDDINMFLSDIKTVIINKRMMDAK